MSAKTTGREPADELQEQRKSPRLNCLHSQDDLRFGDDYEEMSRDVLVEKALESELRWAPGARYGYSNAGYSLLGAVVEKVSGQPYETFLHEQLFRPAGMEKTGYRIPQWKREELAHGTDATNRPGNFPQKLCIQSCVCILPAMLAVCQHGYPDHHPRCL